MPKHTNPYREQILSIVEKSGKSYYQIAKDTGLRESTLQGVRKAGWGRQFITAGKILDDFGYELVIRKKGE